MNWCRCGIKLNDKTAYFENGFGYSTKLIKCPECGNVNIIDTFWDRDFRCGRSNKSINDDIQKYIEDFDKEEKEE